MKHLSYFSLFYILLFQACSTQEAQPPSTTQMQSIAHSESTQTNTSAADDGFTEDDNGFGDEFQDTDNTKSDPLSGYNKVMTDINDKMYIYGLNPLSKGYAVILPEPFRIGISNVFKNLQFPVRFTNNILQGKFSNAKDETERFVTNSTIGLLGLMDPATNLVHVPEHKEDFGQTLGFYGVDAGFHIVLPFLGPSNVRDFAGLAVDAYISPLVNLKGHEKYKIPNNATDSFALIALYYINKNSLEPGRYESLKKDAIELYPFLRDIYEEKRRVEINE